MKPSMLYSGIDLVEIARVEKLLTRFPERFKNRIFTAREQEHARGEPQRLAGKFAAKEATMKLLGNGGRTLPWQSIEVLADESGKPYIVLSDVSQQVAETMGIREISLSITHSTGLAIAMVVSAGGSG